MKEQVYKKKGRRYIPLGYSDGWTGFPADGIWIVQSKDGSKSSECIMRLGELQDMQPSVNLILAYKDRINKYILNNPDVQITNNTINDFVMNMLKEITKE
jgi:hypothetical protein